MRLLLLILGCITCALLHGQSHEKKGDQAWERGRYKTAVNNYSLVEDIDNNKKLLAKRGLGHYKLNKLDRAINDFTKSKSLGNEDSYLYFLMGSAKQHLGQYEEAAFFYKQFVKEKGDKSKEGKIALREIKNSAYAAFNIDKKSTAFVENFGDAINSYYDEVYVLQSPQQGNAFYYTSNNDLSSNEVYLKVVDEKGKWSPDSTRLGGINTAMNDYAMDISPNGQNMIFARQLSDGNTKTYVSAYDVNEKQHIIELPGSMLSGALDLNIVDRNTIAFASKDLGGEGGYDIFTISYKNGVWSDPINQGPIINSEYDERSPYFASNESYLYFSSNRPYSYGGFDIYYYNKLGIAEEPINMGVPLNSAGDDLQFRLHQDGQFAVFSSDRKSGYGAYDIYKAYLHDFKPMPIKDTFQLDYVRDYLEQFQPTQEVVAERRKPRKPRNEPQPKKTNTDSALNEKMEKDEVADEVVIEVPKEEVADDIGSQEDEVVIATNEDTAKDVEIAEKDENLFERIGRLKKTEKESDTVVEETDSDLVEAGEKTDANSQKADDEIKEALEPIQEAEVIIHDDSFISDSNTTKSTEPTDTDRTETKPDKNTSASTHTVSYNSPGSSSGIKNSLLYQDRHDLMNNENKRKLDYLVTYLKSNPDHSIHFIAHTDHLEPGLDEYMQYNTLKRAILIGKYLMENEIERQRISIESVSNNFPAAKEELAGETNLKYLYYNKRVDWEIRDADGIVLTELSVNPNSMPGYAVDRRYELFHQIREDVYFSVEIASTSTIFKNAVLRLYDDIYIRKGTPLADNNYYIGILNTYEDAALLKKELENSSAPYAKIVAFHHGMPITNHELSDFISEFPELQAYKDGQQ